MPFLTTKKLILCKFNGLILKMGVHFTAVGMLILGCMEVGGYNLFGEIGLLFDL